MVNLAVHDIFQGVWSSCTHKTDTTNYAVVTGFHLRNHSGIVVKYSFMIVFLNVTTKQYLVNRGVPGILVGFRTDKPTVNPDIFELKVLRTGIYLSRYSREIRTLCYPNLVDFLFIKSCYPFFTLVRPCITQCRLKIGKSRLPRKAVKIRSPGVCAINIPDSVLVFIGADIYTLSDPGPAGDIEVYAVPLSREIRKFSIRNLCTCINKG